MVNIVLCDDSLTSIENYSAMIDRLANQYEIQVILKTYTSGEQLLFEYEDVCAVIDIVYIDILMGGLNGIEVAQRLRQAGYKGEIIFLTANEEYVFQAFDVDPLHYLVKNACGDQKFEQIFLKAVRLAQNKQKEHYVINSPSFYQKIPLDSLIYFEVNNRIVTVHFGEESVEYYASLESIEAQLGSKGFLRPHRTFLVNAKYIQRIDKTVIKLITGKEIPLSKGKYKEIKQQFSQYLIEQLY